VYTGNIQNAMNHNSSVQQFSSVQSTQMPPKSLKHEQVRKSAQNLPLQKSISRQFVQKTTRDGLGKASSKNSLNQMGDKLQHLEQKSLNHHGSQKRIQYRNTGVGQQRSSGRIVSARRESLGSGERSGHKVNMSQTSQSNGNLK